MRRGFKAEAERISARLRADLGLLPEAPIDPREYLLGRGFLIWEPADVPGFGDPHLAQLTELDSDSWSGVTIREGKTVLVILNPTHAPVRQASTLMHEWAHVELRHKPNRVDMHEGEIMLLSDYPSELEEEANWLSGAALLPRSALLARRSTGDTIDEIASRFGVSIDLTQWRLRMTGIDRQLAYRG